VGLLELDFRAMPDCELSFLGFIPELTGKGMGRWLMAQAMAMAWRKGVDRFRVHTCTLDSPGALGFYRRSGFVPYAREVEIFADPRVAGVLPRDAAPHVPLLE
jgi:GNAT superfamily N-acetyltransferase